MDNSQHSTTLLFIATISLPAIQIIHNDVFMSRQTSLRITVILSVAMFKAPHSIFNLYIPQSCQQTLSPRRSSPACFNMLYCKLKLACLSSTNLAFEGMLMYYIKYNFVIITMIPNLVRLFNPIRILGCLMYINTL